jgi:hypothetical protein
MAVFFTRRRGAVTTFNREEMSSMNRSRLAYVSLGCILLSAVALLAADRNWQNGTLTGTEQEKVKEGSTETSSTEGSAKGKGNKTEFSKDTTATTTDHYETYQIYTIETDNRVYVVKEHLLFPWSKSANVSVGQPVKFAAEKNKVYILDDDKKEHKATIVKVNMKEAQ